MNYLGRPVFQFPIDWSEPVNKSFAYDLKEQAIGFGPEFFASLQENVIQGFSFTAWLQSNVAIAAFDVFTAALSGRLVGFWLPAPMEGMQINAVTSTTVFNILAQGLADTWEERPDIYLYFSAPGQTPVAAKILSVVDSGSTETVTVGTVVPWLTSAPIPQMSVFRLHYVRLAADVEQGKFLKENSQLRTVKVVELPQEYSAVETGTQRILLYEISCNAPVNITWRYTSFAAPVQSAGFLYTYWPLKHKTLRRGKTLDGETLEIECKYDPSHPFSLFLPYPLPRPMTLKVYEVSFAAPDTRTCIFAGRVIRVADDPGEYITAKCESMEYIISFKVPGPLIGTCSDADYGAFCPYAVFDPNTCKALRAPFEAQAAITDIDSDALPPTVTVQFIMPDLLTPQYEAGSAYNANVVSPVYTNGIITNWVATGKTFATGIVSGWTATTQTALFANGKVADFFAQGFLETGFGTGYELRVIQNSTWNAGAGTMLLNLNVELVNAEVGDVIQLIAGCDGRAQTCMSKFDNYLNFGGFPAIPVVNPSLSSFYNNVMMGGKSK